MKKTAIVSIIQKALSGIIFFILFCMVLFSIASISEAAQNRTINGTYLISLSMPGGTKDSTLVLVSDGEKITGTISAPGDPSEVSPIRDGRYADGKLTLSAVIGRITYVLEGGYKGDTLIFDMTTLETIPLDNGSRLSGKTGDITGAYRVPVYSPGGIKENQVELVAENGVITGEMYSVGNSGGPSGGAPEGTGGARGNMGPPPGGEGAKGGEAPGAGINASTGGKQDLNTFYDGTHKGNNISFFTKTAQGSIFHFTGAVDDDTIKLTMQVTDKTSGIEAKKK
jgi:hypothetical protein